MVQMICIPLSFQFINQSSVRLLLLTTNAYYNYLCGILVCSHAQIAICQFDFNFIVIFKSKRTRKKLYFSCCLLLTIAGKKLEYISAQMLLCLV